MSKKLSPSEKQYAKKIGDTIYLNLKIKNLSQMSLSKITNIPSSTISSYVRGISIPSLENIDKICSALDISSDEFRPSSFISKGERQGAFEYLMNISYEQYLSYLKLSCNKFDDIYRSEEEYDSSKPSEFYIQFGNIYYVVKANELKSDEFRHLVESIENFIEEKSTPLLNKIALQSGNVADLENDN